MAVLVVRLVDETAWFLPTGTLEQFRADLGLTYAQAGIVLAAAAPGGIAGTVFSAAADHHSRRAIAAGGALAFALALGVFAAGGNLLVLVAASFLAGMAATAMVDAAEVALVDLAAAAGGDLRRYLARGNLLGAAGDLIGPALVAGVALSGASWRVVFAVGAVMLAAYGIALSLTPLPPPAPASVDGDGEGPSTARATILAVLADRRVWLVGAASLLLGPFDESFLGFAIALLDEVRGASAAVANLVAVAGLTGGVLTFTVLATRVEQVEDRRLLVGSAAALGVSVLVVGLVPALPLVALGAFVASVALNLGWLAVQHRTLTLRPGQAGTTKAVVSTIEFAAFLVPVAVGAAADRYGLPVAVAGHVVLAAALAAVALADRQPTAS